MHRLMGHEKCDQLVDLLGQRNRLHNSRARVSTGDISRATRVSKSLADRSNALHICSKDTAGKAAISREHTK